MLGNFSFGDYFKEEAIRYAWEFLTDEMKLPVDKLWITVFREDDEAFAIWRDQIGLPEERVIRMGEKDNFWSMGDTGPCGPCSEIHIDQGDSMACGPDCGIGRCDCDRYLELWNLVFMQFDRSADGSMTPLPKPSIDTGMGLERITAVVQGVQSNYDCDLLRGIIAFIEKVSGKRYGADEEQDVSMRVIADHSRATAFLIADGVLPSNEGRGYVLRRIMRRAARHAKMLGFGEPVLYRSCVFVLESMAEAYPEVSQRTEYVAKVVKNEEERFIQTLDNGLRILNDELLLLEQQKQTVLPGEIAFRLYDTYGFPLDLTADIIADKGFGIDEDGFANAMEEQRRKAREHWKGSGEEAVAEIYRQLLEEGLRSEFCGYDGLTGHSEILAILHDGQPLAEADTGSSVEIITAATPFYGESGGQSGDRGTLSTASGTVIISDTKKPLPGLTVHIGTVVSGRIARGTVAELAVDDSLRQATALNHTCTHILQQVLVETLGEHVQQAGSLVTPDRLRFDFIHFSALTAEELSRIEEQVNRRIRNNLPVATEQMSTDAAVAAGATALFGEKYGDSVRVVRVGDFSMELCGGTHVERTGAIGPFRILSERGVAAGVRRIEALAGHPALAREREDRDLLARLEERLGAHRDDVVEQLERRLEQLKALQKENEALSLKLARGESGGGGETVDVDGISVVARRAEGLNKSQRRDLADGLRQKHSSGVVVLGAADGEKAALLVAVGDEARARIDARDVIRRLAPIVGGGGGGRPDLAEAGGKNPAALDDALAAAAQAVRETLES